MSKLLFDEQPLVVDRKLSKIIGLNEAIVVQQIHYWLVNNKKNSKNFHEGRYWTYNSIKEWQEKHFEFWSVDTVKRVFNKLEKMNIFISGNFNKERRDRTKWYTIDYEELEKLVSEANENNDINTEEKEGENIKTDDVLPNALGQNAPMDKGKKHQCTGAKSTDHYQRITTENNTENNNTKTTSSSDHFCPMENNKDISIIAKEFEQSGFGTINLTVKELLEELLKNYSVEWIIQAFKIAVKKNKRRLDYVEGILENWLRDGGMKLGGDKDGKSSRDNEESQSGKGPSEESLRLERIAREKGLLDNLEDDIDCDF